MVPVVFYVSHTMNFDERFRKILKSESRSLFSIELFNIFDFSDLIFINIFAKTVNRYKSFKV